MCFERERKKEEEKEWINRVEYIYIQYYFWVIIHDGVRQVETFKIHNCCCLLKCKLCITKELLNRYDRKK